MKTRSLSQQHSYIRYLQLDPPTIYAFQETHATETNTDSLNRLFRNRQTIWTQHCGLVSFSPDYILTNIETTLSDRAILSRVHHPHDFYQPFFILNLYAPTSPPADRRLFFDTITNFLSSSDHDIDMDRLFIVGDFNYSLSRSGLNHHTSTQWLALLDENFYNSMTFNNRQDEPTFKRSHFTSSTIDFIYVSNNLRMSIVDNLITPMPPNWSDHSTLSITLTMGTSKLGPGLWRANPLYVNNTKYKEQLENAINLFFALDHQNTSPQDQWDQLKAICQSTTKKFGKKYVPWRQQVLQQLQQKRHRFLSGKPTTALRQQVLATLDPQIHSIQQEMTDIAALKAGIRWREKGESSPKYLKSIHTTRTAQQYLSALSVNHGSGPTTMDQEEIRTITKDFYQTLYSKDEVDPPMIDEYLRNINLERQLTGDDQQLLLTPITIQDLETQARRVTQASSPGEDGLGYPYWSLLLQFDQVKSLALKVYNQALTDGIFPTSWQQIRVRLLPKKGDTSSLRNWRPISLINCDAKLFTRLITQRMAPVVAKLLNPYQTGFVPGRFIAENGMALKIVMEQAQINDTHGIGLLLDQEKAYDRVHPDYLRRTLLAFGFPTTLVDSLINLFFGNQVQINVNGFFTDNVNQERGLRQGDPLSPLLFNLALEPLLLSIIQDHLIQGYRFTAQHNMIQTPPNLKCLAYADDVCIFLTQQSDLDQLLAHMDQYARVSNARFNEHKTEAFSLSGSMDTTWHDRLQQEGMQVYHNKHSTSSFRYLGFPMFYTTIQRDESLAKLLESVQQQIGIYNTRNISIKGRTIVANTLILSKLWYCLRLTSVPKVFFEKIRSCIHRFVWQGKYPIYAYKRMCLPIQQGGLALLDAPWQQKVLQLRWIRNILLPNERSTLITDMLLHHLSLAGPPGVPPLIPLLCPKLRCGPSSSSQHILPMIFKAYDTLELSINYSKLNVDTCLHLPLSSFFLDLPDGHWIEGKKHKSDQGSLVFIKDELLNCLRIKVATEPRQFPQLQRLLLKNVLNSHIRLQPWVWDLITTRPAMTDSIDLTSIINWPIQPEELLTPTMLRTTSRQSVPHHHQFNITDILRFWKAPMDLEARTVWYKVLVGKIALRPYLRTVGRASTSLCHMCLQDYEDLQHFVVGCQKKYQTWQRVFRYYYPDLVFTVDIIYSTLCSLSLPATILDQGKFITICGTTLHKLWLAHWASSIHQVNLDPDKLGKAAVERINLLLQPRRHID